MPERVLDAAERLLARGNPTFSMRELATEAGVSFATPFNQFGSKGAIMLALSTRRIVLMHERLVRATLPPAALARVQLAGDIAVKVMLSAPTVNRAIMGSIGSPGIDASDVSARSGALWALALGAGEGLSACTRSMALAVLPHQLAVAFRGVLSFWTAGEIANAALSRRTHAALSIALLGFVERKDRAAVLAAIR